MDSTILVKSCDSDTVQQTGAAPFKKIASPLRVSLVVG